MLQYSMSWPVDTAVLPAAVACWCCVLVTCWCYNVTCSNALMLCVQQNGEVSTPQTPLCDPTQEPIFPPYLKVTMSVGSFDSLGLLNLFTSNQLAQFASVIRAYSVVMLKALANEAIKLPVIMLLSIRFSTVFCEEKNSSIRQIVNLFVYTDWSRWVLCRLWSRAVDGTFKSTN